MIRDLAGATLFVLASCAVQTQPPPAFEVASIKPAAPMTGGRMMVRMGGDPGRINYTGVTLKDVLARAYDVKRYQISGPSWLDSERYDIVAKVPDGAPREQIPAMLQSLLAERFKMAVHRESKQQPAYALVVGKNGPKLKKSEVTGDSGARATEPRGTMMMSSNGRLEARKTTLGAFSDLLSKLLDRPVVDLTKLEGYYDITLEVAMEDLAGMRKLPAMAGPGPGGPRQEGGPAPDSAPSASIFTAVQQLGLKLDTRKLPIDYIVVGQANKVPTEN
ncbi:MAG: TIGR03435 family protein [Acidobacteria bacterium]|nr:TIGR03435 family protein [Acidobacteriota bacterium]